MLHYGLLLLVTIGPQLVQLDLHLTERVTEDLNFPTELPVVLTAILFSKSILRKAAHGPGSTSDLLLILEAHVILGIGDDRERLRISNCTRLVSHVILIPV